MTVRLTHLAGVALIALAGVGVSLPAQAKTAAKHHHAAAAPKPNPQAEEIKELRSEVQALTERLNAKEARDQEVQAQAQQAQATAQAATTQVQQVQTHADAEIKTIPAQVQTAVAALPKPKTGWWEGTTVGGRVYYDVTSIDQKNDGVKQAQNGVNFDIKRFYISIDHTFNKTFSANITTDFNYDSGPAAATQLYIKKAYLQAKLSDAAVIRLGSTDLPWVPFVEDIYGYRYLEQTLIDRTKFGTSADWGVHLAGKVPAGMVTFNYALAAINGSGYKKPGLGALGAAGSTRTKGIDLEGRLSATMSDFTAAVGGYTGKLGKDVEGGAPTFHNAERFDALLSYKGKRFQLAGEYFYAKDWADVLQANPLLTNSTEGYSVFGSVKLTPQVAVFGRYDWVKPKRDTAPMFHDNYFNVGVSWSPAKIVDFALTYKRDKVDNGLLSTGNGTIGGVLSGTYDEVGLFGQYRW